MNNFSLSLNELAQLCGGTVFGNGDLLINSVCSIGKSKPHSISFIVSQLIFNKISDSSLVAIVKPEWAEKFDSGICHTNPQQAFRLILAELTQRNSLSALSAVADKGKIADTAIISKNAKIGQNVILGQSSVIADGVEIGDNAIIGHNVVIEDNTVIGQNTRIDHNVTIHYNTKIGDNCVISSGAVIAGQGFGFSLEAGQWEPIPQVGRVVIGNNVHIGSNTCIDRGAIDDTIIADNVIIDNLVHIAHNVTVGSGSAMAAGVGIAGSTNIGKYCLLAGQVGVVGHISIADGVQVNGGAKVLQPIKESGIYAGSFNALPVRQWNKIAVYIKKIEQLFKRG